MLKRMGCALIPFLILLAAASLPFVALRADDVPVAPIPLVGAEEDQPQYLLRAGPLRLEVSPRGAGRIRIVVGTQETTWETPLHGLFADLRNIPLEPGSYWESRAWKTSEGAQVVMLTRRLPAPLGYAISHIVTLPPAGDGVWITSRFTALSNLPYRVLPLTVVIPAPQAPPPFRLWLRSKPGNDETDGWTDAAQQSDAAVALVENGQSLWQWNWRLALDEGGALPARSHAGADACELRFVASLPSSLPPMGWTLQSELRLTLSPIPSGVSPRDVFPKIP